MQADMLNKAGEYRKRLGMILEIPDPEKKANGFHYLHAEYLNFFNSLPPYVWQDKEIYGAFSTLNADFNFADMQIEPPALRDSKRSHGLQPKYDRYWYEPYKCFVVPGRDGRFRYIKEQKWRRYAGLMIFPIGYILGKRGDILETEREIRKALGFSERLGSAVSDFF